MAGLTLEKKVIIVLVLPVLMVVLVSVIGIYSLDYMQELVLEEHLSLLTSIQNLPDSVETKALSRVGAMFEKKATALIFFSKTFILMAAVMSVVMSVLLGFFLARHISQELEPARAKGLNI